MNRDYFLEMASLADWRWGETGMLALLVIIAGLTMRSIVERDGAIWMGRDKRDEAAKRAAYDTRWRTGGMTGA